MGYSSSLHRNVIKSSLCNSHAMTIESGTCILYLLADFSGDVVCTLASQWQSRVGYCLQFGGLLELLTANETLRLFARLRGVPDKAIEPLVHSLVALVGLTEHADRQCRTYR